MSTVLTARSDLAGDGYATSLTNLEQWLDYSSEWQELLFSALVVV